MEYAKIFLYLVLFIPIFTACNGGLISNDEDLLTEEIFVQFNPDITNNTISYSQISSELHYTINATIIKDFSNSGLPGLQLIGLDGNITVSDAIEYYSSNPNVVYAEPNGIIKFSPPQFIENLTNTEEKMELQRIFTVISPNDPFFGSQWGLSTIHIQEAWDISKGSENIIIAVIDSGIDYNHPDLSGNIWLNIDEMPGNGIDDDHNGYIDDIRGWDCYNDDNNPYDDFYHGTFIAGIIGATLNNNVGGVGVCPNIKLMPLKIGDQTGASIDAEIEAILYAKNNGAQIVCLANGGPNYYQTEFNAIQNSPMLFICAAGNSQNNNDITGYYPPAFSCPNIIAVAASDESDQLAKNSNYGVNTVDIASPGIHILSTLPGSGFGYGDGTSFAAPFVAGVVGLIKAKNPSLANNQIKDIILLNADISGSFNGKVKSAGRLNAYRALSAAPWPTPTTIPTTVPTTIPTTVPTTIPTTVPPTSASEYTITAIPDQNGVLAPAGLVKVPTGSKQQFTIIPLPGYKIDRVIVDGNNKGSINMYTFEDVRSDHTLYAYFIAENQQSNQINLALEPGWNFISTPKSLKDGFDTIDSVIGSTDTANHSIYLYDASTSKWIILKRNSKVTPLDGIWVYSNSRNLANFVINDVNEKPAKSIYGGWNAAGCTELDQKSVKENFNSINNIWTSTIGFNALNQLYETSLINGGSGSHSDSNILVPGKGYWIYSSGSGTLIGI